MSRRRKQRRASQAEKTESRQPNRTVARMGWLLKGGGSLLLLLLLVVLGGYLWVRSYLRSEEFREQLGNQIGAAAGGKAEVGEIEWHGIAMEVGQLDLQSRKTGDWQLREVDVDVDLSGFWDKVWIVPLIEVRQARSEWDFRKKKEEEVKVIAMPQKSSLRKSAPGFLPNRVEVREVLVRDYEGEVRLESGDYSWDGMSLRMEPGNQFAKLIELEGGRLKTPFDWLGTLELESGTLTLREGEVSLSQSKWKAEAGRLEFGGDLVAEAPSYRAEITDWNILSLLPPELAPFFSGQVTGKLDWEAEVADGRVAVEAGTVKGLPFMNRLAAYVGTPRLRRITLEEARARISREGETWALSEIVLFDEGLLRVEGDFLSKPEGPAGTLQLGVPPGFLVHIPGAEEKVFLPGKGGLLWAEVKISGTWEEPKEDLSERMIRAAGERMFEMIPETGQWALRYGTRAVDQGTAILLENQGVILEQGTRVAEEAIEQGGNVVEEGIKTGFGILDGILGGEEKQ